MWHHTIIGMCIIVSFHKPVPMRPNYNITISMPINAYTKCVFALDSNANDGRCREPWKLTACIFISIQITISRDSSIICRRGCCYSFETMSQTNPNAIYDVFSWIEIVFEKFMLHKHMRMRWLAISIEKKFRHCEEMNESWNCWTRAGDIFNLLRLHHLTPTTSTMWTPRCFITSLCARTRVLDKFVNYFTF